MGALPQTNYVSPEEYLRLENDRADDGRRCEYNNGKIYSMAGASRNHNLLFGDAMSGRWSILQRGGASCALGVGGFGGECR